MKSRFENNKEYLLLLSKCKKKFRNHLILHSDKDQIYSICECLLNIAKGNISIDKNSFEKLKPFKKTFKKVLDKKINLKDKKKLLIQKGGFLSVLIPALISGISSIISASISKQSNE